MVGGWMGSLAGRLTHKATQHDTTDTHPQTPAPPDGGGGDGGSLYDLEIELETGGAAFRCVVVFFYEGGKWVGSVKSIVPARRLAWLSAHFNRSFASNHSNDNQTRPTV